MLLKKVLLKKVLLVVLIIVGALSILSGAYILSTKDNKSAIVSRELKKEILHSKPNSVKLVIKDLNLALPISEGKIVNGVWEIAQTGVSHLDSSANPGEGENIVIYGHNKKVIFGSLPFLKMGAKILIISKDGKVYEYKVFRRDSVKATDISIALSTKREILTLYTCDGPLDSTRFVIQAEPVKSQKAF